jgi:hypothetical protein
LIFSERGFHMPTSVDGIDDGVGYGVKGESTGVSKPTSPTGQGIGVWGTNSGTGIGVFGSSQSGIGVEAVSDSTETTTSTAASFNVGLMARSDSGDGIFSSGGRNGIHGQSASATDSGVWGENTGAGTGVAGSSKGGNGVAGQSWSDKNSGVWGDNFGAGTGVAGSSVSGVGVGGSSKGGNGVTGQSWSDKDSGVWGNNSGAGTGVAGSSFSGIGVGGSSVSGNAGEFTGKVLVTGVLTVKEDIQLVGADCAEHFDVANEQQLEPGTVVVIDQEGALRESCDAYDKKVAGVVSGAGEYKPGIVLDRRESNRKRIPVALVGKVYCKVDAEYAPIDVGDLLTASPTPGHAMKATDPLRAFGAVIGKALRPLRSGTALIPVLVALQ